MSLLIGSGGLYEFDSDISTFFYEIQAQCIKENQQSLTRRQGRSGVVHWILILTWGLWRALVIIVVWCGATFYQYEYELVLIRSFESNNVQETSVPKLCWSESSLRSVIAPDIDLKWMSRLIRATRKMTLLKCRRAIIDSYSHICSLLLQELYLDGRKKHWKTGQRRLSQSIG